MKKTTLSLYHRALSSQQASNLISLHCQATQICTQRLDKYDGNVRDSKQFIECGEPWPIPGYQYTIASFTGSYCGFLLKASHVWRTSRDLFLQVHNWNSTRGKPCGDRMDLWAFMYQKGIAKVSLRVSLWDWRECGKQGTIPSFACKHEWTNCISRYCKVGFKENREAGSP